MDVYSLSDAELLDQLNAHNIDHGPVTEFTRRVYQKKLSRVIQGDDVTDSLHSHHKTLPFNVQEEEEEEEEEEPTTVYYKPKQEPVREPIQRPYVDKSPVMQSVDRPTSSYTRVSHRNLPSTRVAPPRPQPAVPPTTKQDKPKKSGLSIWLQLIIIIILAVIIFLVFQNMEPANKNPTGQIAQEV